MYCIYNKYNESLKPSLLREGAERSEAEGFFLSVSDAAKTKTLRLSPCRGEAATKNPSVSGQKNVRSQLPLAREPFKNQHSFYFSEATVFLPTGQKSCEIGPDARHAPIWAHARVLVYLSEPKLVRNK